MTARKSPFPDFDPDKQRYKRNLHVVIVLIALSILYTLGLVMYAIYIAVAIESPHEPMICPLWEMATLLVFYGLNLPTLLLMALKRDFLDNRWAPLKTLTLVVVSLGSFVVAALEGPTIYRHIWDFVLLIVFPLTLYFGGVIFGRSPIGGRFFAPFQIKGSAAEPADAPRDLEKQPPNASKTKPSIVMTPVRPTGQVAA
jgi:hypothetical protein